MPESEYSTKEILELTKSSLELAVVQKELIPYILKAYFELSEAFDLIGAKLKATGVNVPNDLKAFLKRKAVNDKALRDLQSTFPQK